jgi:uncharacterized protein (DUF1778 family)
MTIKRRKPRAQRKEESIRIRATTAQKEALEEAAQKTGLGLSGWLLALGLKEAAAMRRDGG